MLLTLHKATANCGSVITALQRLEGKPHVPPPFLQSYWLGCAWQVISRDNWEHIRCIPKFNTHNNSVTLPRIRKLCYVIGLVQFFQAQGHNSSVARDKYTNALLVTWGSKSRQNEPRVESYGVWKIPTSFCNWLQHVMCRQSSSAYSASVDAVLLSCLVLPISADILWCRLPLDTS